MTLTHALHACLSYACVSCQGRSDGGRVNTFGARSARSTVTSYKNFTAVHINRHRTVLAATLRPVLPKSNAHTMYLISAYTSMALQTEQAQQKLINSHEIQSVLIVCPIIRVETGCYSTGTTKILKGQVDLESLQRHLHSNMLCG